MAGSIFSRPPFCVRDDRRELPGGRDGASGPLRHDSARDLCRHSFLPKFTENPCQFLDRSVRHDVGGASAASAHSHVEWTVPAKREPALRAVELHRGDAEIREDSVGRRRALEDASRSPKFASTSATRSPNRASRSRARARASRIAVEAEEADARARARGAPRRGRRRRASRRRRSRRAPGASDSNDLVDEDRRVRAASIGVVSSAHVTVHGSLTTAASKARRSPRDRSPRSRASLARRAAIGDDEVIDVAGDDDVGRELRGVAQDLRHEHAALPVERRRPGRRS